jgi:hypothetical protein
MPLDRKRLENVKGKPDGSYTARCPACTASGGDSQGNHLIVFADAKYGCAAKQSDGEHRKEIWKLAGIKASGKKRREIIAVCFPKYEVKRLVIPAPTTVMVLPQR